MFANFIEVLLLSFVQGISEFIPVSSSAHLFLISEIYHFKYQTLTLDISLHLGSLLAIIFYFRKDLFNILNNRKLFLLIIIGSLPLIICGFLVLKTGMINNFRNMEVIAWTTFIFAILLYIADKVEVKKKLEANIDLKSIIIIGLFQIFALIPGVSRSGIVLTAARFINFNRYDSTKISFYLSIPAIAGASFLGLKNISYEDFDFNLIILFSIIFSFFTSFLTIKYFLIFVKKFSLNLFVIYRIILSLLLFYIIYF
tara:strand:+ start:206 stop:973 length:768 start_codon:yes stop_codon:yes gene_type:complete